MTARTGREYSRASIKPEQRQFDHGGDRQQALVGLPRELIAARHNDEHQPEDEEQQQGVALEAVGPNPSDSVG